MSDVSAHQTYTRDVCDRFPEIAILDSARIEPTKRDLRREERRRAKLIAREAKRAVQADPSTTSSHPRHAFEGTSVQEQRNDSAPSFNVPSASRTTLDTASSNNTLADYIPLDFSIDDEQFGAWRPGKRQRYMPKQTTRMSKRSRQQHGPVDAPANLAPNESTPTQRTGREGDRDISKGLTIAHGGGDTRPAQTTSRPSAARNKSTQVGPNAPINAPLAIGGSLSADPGPHLPIPPRVAHDSSRERSSVVQVVHVRRQDAVERVHVQDRHQLLDQILHARDFQTSQWG